MCMCVCACEEGCLPFNVVCKKESRKHTQYTAYICMCVCKWVGPFTHTHETKFVLWPQRCHSQQSSRQKKGAACCCNCSKKTGNAPTQTAVSVCLYSCRHIYLHMYCTYIHTYTYVRAYVRHMQFKCPYWFPELNICKMIIHCAASVASVCYRCHCPLRHLAYNKKLIKQQKNATCAPKVTLNTNTRTYEWYVQTYTLESCMNTLYCRVVYCTKIYRTYFWLYKIHLHLFKTVLKKLYP